MTNSPSNARFSWQKSRWTGSASVSGRMQEATGYPCWMPAENSTRETQPLETHGHRGWIEVSVARPVSTSQQTGDGDVKPHQPSDEASQQAVPIWYGIKSSINKDFLKVIWLCGHLASTKRRKWRLNEPLKRPPIKTFGAVGRKSFKEIFKKFPGIP